MQDQLPAWTHAHCQYVREGTVERAGPDLGGADGHGG